MDLLDFYFTHVTTIQVSQLTRCGQTRLVQRKVKEQLIQLFAIWIIWVYNEWQPDYDLIRVRYSGKQFENKCRDVVFDCLSREQRNILDLSDQMGVENSSK